MLPKSHPNKLLIEHIKGINLISDVDDLFLIASMFHDIGKINHNFQQKINGITPDGYSHHSYISSYYLINGFVNNKNEIKNRFNFINDDNFNDILLILINIITGHHGYLRNIKEIFNIDEWNEMIKYLKSNDITNDVNDFFRLNKDVLNCDISFKELSNFDYYKSFGNPENYKKWKEDSLEYYFKTLITYSELINSDRKDASNNKIEYRKLNRLKFLYSLENNLNWVFNNFKEDSELNKVRTQIRKSSINSLKNNINERILTLTSPTGSGKTLMMLQLAVEINKIKDYQYDIIYSLPFLSIIDQTTKILNDTLKIETLNYTSSSDTSEKLKNLLNEDNRKELIDYAFSENCFDHPFIITTFNKLFETLLSNSGGVLMKLKNFKKRIFLIDEFQAISPSLYSTFIYLLKYFCEKYDSYAIISTATMPTFNIDLNNVDNINAKKLFKNNLKINELLNKTIFDYDVFNRYTINFIGKTNPEKLYSDVNKSSKSTLLIMNTVRASRTMYSMFDGKSSFEKRYILNSNITPDDRKNILNNIKEDLKNNKKIIVVSTQVIEAGVDISFPVVFRDVAPPPSIIQSGGRGNRNGEFGMIDMFVFYYKEIFEYDAILVYGNDISNKFINDVINKIPPINERNFHERCKIYFEHQSNIVKHGKVSEELNIINSILNGDFISIGKYKHITSNPNNITIYVGDDNNLWLEYINILGKIKQSTTYDERNIYNIELKKTRSKILQNTVNLNDGKIDYSILSEDTFGIYRLKNNNFYDRNTGFIL